MPKSLRFKPKKRNRTSQTHKRVSYVWWFFTVLCLFVFVVGLAFVNVQLWQKRQKIKQNISDLENQIKAELKEVQTNNAIDESPAYLERVAREELNLRKPGENVVAFPQKIEPEIDNTEGLLQKIKEKEK